MVGQDASRAPDPRHAIVFLFGANASVNDYRPESGQNGDRARVFHGKGASRSWCPWLHGLAPARASCAATPQVCSGMRGHFPIGKWLRKTIVFRSRNPFGFRRRFPIGNRVPATGGRQDRTVPDPTRAWAAPGWPRRDVDVFLFNDAPGSDMLAGVVVAGASSSGSPGWTVRARFR